MMFIYGLVDPRTLLIRYIGQTIQGHRRTRAHRRDPANPYQANWIRQLVSSGLDYQVVVLQRCTHPSQLDDAEVWWIAYGKMSRWPLTNFADGGRVNRGIRPSAETRAKLSAAKRGRTVSTETRTKLSQAHKRRLQDPTNRARWLAINPASTPEHAKRTSRIIKALWADPVSRERIMIKHRAAKPGRRAAMLSRWQEPEARSRMLDAMRSSPNSGVWKQPENRARMMETTWKDPEIRARRIEGMKRAWVRRRANSNRL